ncbi:hypothetical protein [Ruegeria hyattellae]|uniref:hypothetical protein n=1 Tax=Ruegeria hyattellae TaxID=3233337 RepID=UPI00355C9736
MREQDSGTIINISSGAANSFLEGWSHYCAIKASNINPVGQLDPLSHIPAKWVAKAIAYLCGRREFNLSDRTFRRRLRRASIAQAVQRSKT